MGDRSELLLPSAGGARARPPAKYAMVIPCNLSSDGCIRVMDRGRGRGSAGAGVALGITVGACVSVDP